MTVDDELVDRILRRSLLDLRILASDLDGERYYAAGVPWYATLFGRDSVIVGIENVWEPEMGSAVLRRLAALHQERDGHGGAQNEGRREVCHDGGVFRRGDGLARQADQIAPRRQQRRSGPAG